MPGIENLAPDRTETSSGLLASPRVRPDVLLDLRKASSVCSHSPGGNSPPASW